MPRKQNTPCVKQPYRGKPDHLAFQQFEPPPDTPKPRPHGMAMSVEQMSEELAIGRNVAYQLIRQPDFPSFMIGRRVLISRKGLQDWIDEQCKRGCYIPDYGDPEIPESIEK